MLALTRIAIALSLTVVVAVSACAHPFHVSIAEAEYNSGTKTLEVALRVHPSDLEAALRRQTGEPIVLETSPNVDEEIIAYLRRTLVVTPRGEKPAKLRWVGKEIAVKHVWLYFEIPLPRGLNDVEITHRVFFELLSDQVNTITFRDGERRATLHLTRRHMTRKIAWE